MRCMHWTSFPGFRGSWEAIHRYLKVYDSLRRFQCKHHVNCLYVANPLWSDWAAKCLLQPFTYVQVWADRWNCIQQTTGDSTRVKRSSLWVRINMHKGTLMQELRLLLLVSTAILERVGQKVKGHSLNQAWCRVQLASTHVLQPYFRGTTDWLYDNYCLKNQLIKMLGL